MHGSLYSIEKLNAWAHMKTLEHLQTFRISKLYRLLRVLLIPAKVQVAVMEELDL